MEARRGALFIAGARGGNVAPPECSGSRRTATKSASARGQGFSVKAEAVHARGRAQGGGGEEDRGTGALWLWPRRAHAHCGCSGIGERQGGVKGDETRVVARCGNLRRAPMRARAKQSHWRRRARRIYDRGLVLAWSPRELRLHDALSIKFMSWVLSSQG